jgi:hypothetical protein
MIGTTFDRTWVTRSTFGIACVLFLVSLFARLGTPLMWNDEAETAMYATRILQYGYPKVHDGKNNLYIYDGPTQMRAYDARTDAYVNSGWAQFYFAAPGVWVAQHFADPNLRTAILRLPFALVGVFGIALLAFVLAQFFRRRLLVASAFITLSALCIPLILHLREVRYYSIAFACMAGIIWLYTSRYIHHRLSFRAYTWGLAALLVGTFLTFHPLFLTSVATLGLFELIRARRHWRDVLRGILPLVTSAVLVLPFAVYFRTFSLSQELNNRFGFVFADYIQNVGTILIDLSKSSFLIPTIIVATLIALAYREAPIATREGTKPFMHGGMFLVTFVVVTVATISGSTILHQRYYFFLMPVLACAFILAVATCRALLYIPGEPARTQQFKHWIVVGLAMTVATPLVLNGSTIVGHVQELATPYRGTVDYVVSYVRSHYSHPEQLVIATNYEEHSYMYYLGSRVTIGQVLNNLPEDLTYQPDIIIPRQLWKFAAYPHFDAFRKAETYHTVEFPIADSYVNNIPELRHPRFYHQFTARSPGDQPPMVIYVRVDRPAP